MNAKFRVFDIRRNCYDTKTKFLIDCEGYLYAERKEGNEVLIMHNFVIEWWTEKHDKHGKKIFEGDLCKGLVNTCPVVKSDKFRWGEHGIIVEQGDCDFVEIIGNIHGVEYHG